MVLTYNELVSIIEKLAIIGKWAESFKQAIEDSEHFLKEEDSPILINERYKRALDLLSTIVYLAKKEVL